jgi:hypothetical protein
MVTKIKDILAMIDTKDMIAELGHFEDRLDVTLAPLQTLLEKDIRDNPEPGELMDHMTDVERWRERTVRFLSVANTFLEHCKSDHFKLKSGKGITEFDRKSYQKNLTAGFQGMQTYLEGLVYCIDSRVNLCKRVLGIEFDGAKFGSKGL